jgi:hypothetical protein
MKPTTTTVLYSVVVAALATGLATTVINNRDLQSQRDYAVKENSQLKDQVIAARTAVERNTTTSNGNSDYCATAVTRTVATTLQPVTQHVSNTAAPGELPAPGAVENMIAEFNREQERIETAGVASPFGR